MSNHTPREHAYIKALNALLSKHSGFENGMTVEHTNGGPVLMKNGHVLQQHKYDFILKDICAHIQKY